MRSGKSREKSRLLERYFASYEKYTEFLDNTNYTGVDRKLILDFLKLGAMEECDPFVEEYFAAIGENNYQSLLLRQYLTMDIFYCIQEFLKGLGEGNVTISPEVTDIKRIPKVIVSVDTTKMYLKEQFQAAIEARNSVSNDRYGSVIQSAKEYIKKKLLQRRTVIKQDRGPYRSQSQLFQLYFQAGNWDDFCGISYESTH